MASNSSGQIDKHGEKKLNRNKTKQTKKILDNTLTLVLIHAVAIFKG